MIAMTQYLSHRHFGFWRRAVCVLACVAIPFNCRSKDDSPRPRRALPRIAVVCESLSDPSYAAVEWAAQAYVEGHPAQAVELLAPRIASPAAQRDILNDAGRESFAALCLMPLDVSAVESILNSLSRQGLPTILIGRDISRDARFAYCGPSQADIGAAAAQACRAAMPPGSSMILVLAPAIHAEPHAARLTALRATLGRGGRDVRIIEVPCDEEPLAARRTWEAELAKYPRAGGWVLLDDWPLRVMAADEPLPTLNMAVIVCSPSPRHVPRIQRGELTALIGYDLQDAAHRALCLASAAATRADAAIRDDIVPTLIVTRDNAADYERMWGIRSGSGEGLMPDAPQ